MLLFFNWKITRLSADGILSRLIWVKTVCKGYQLMMKSITSGQRVKQNKSSIKLTLHFFKCPFNIISPSVFNLFNRSDAFSVLAVEFNMLLPEITIKCMLGNFSCFCCRLLMFFKINFFDNFFFRNTIRASNSLDPDQA